jgi:hypothetical protein
MHAPSWRRNAVAAACLAAAVWPAAHAPTAALAGSVTVSVDAGSNLGTVSSLLLGHNVEWTSADQTASTATGAPYTSVMGLLQPLQAPFVRFPGGLLANCFDWNSSVTQYDSNGNPFRNNQLGYGFVGGGCSNAGVEQFGTDEFMAMVNQLNSAAVSEITLNVCSKKAVASACALQTDGNGTSICPEPQLPVTTATCPGAIDAANWMAYLDGTSSLDANVQLRTRNGHAAPYNAQYFELGNEVYSLKESVYLNIVKAYVTTMRNEATVASVQEPVLIGAVENGGVSNWDSDMVSKGGVDFLIPHIYPPAGDDQTALLTAPGSSQVRSQSWPLTAPASASYTLQAYASTACSSITAAVDGTALAAGTSTPGPGPYTNTCQWTGSLSAGQHVLTFQLSNTSEVGISGVQLCTDSTCASATPVAVGPYVADPLAIAILGNGQHVSGVSQVTPSLPSPVSGVTTVTVSAYALPTPGTLAKTWNCGSLNVTLGGTTQTVNLANPAYPLPGAAPCYSVFAPDQVSLTFNVAQPVSSLALSFNGGSKPPYDVDVVSASVNGTALSLGYYGTQPPDANQVVYSYGQRIGQWLQGMVQQVHTLNAAANVVASEWDLSPWIGTPATAHYPESLRGGLLEALVLQNMATAGLVAANYFAFDSDIYWHIFHCDPNSESDGANQCGAPGASPYLSIPGRMFAMLAGHFAGTRLTTSTSGPTFSIPPDVGADFRVHWGGTVDLPEVSAFATRSGSSLNIELVNVSPTDSPLVTLTVSNATPGASPALTYLSGNPDDVDTCKFVPVGPCTPTDTAVKQQPGSVTVSGQSLSFTLPATSFALLTVPLA